MDGFKSEDFLYLNNRFIVSTQYKKAYKKIVTENDLNGHIK